MAYKLEGDTVTLTVTLDQYMTLGLALGYAGGAAELRGERGLFARFVRLANELNEGNPNWRPYEVPDEGPPQVTQ